MDQLKQHRLLYANDVNPSPSSQSLQTEVIGHMHTVHVAFFCTGMCLCRDGMDAKERRLWDIDLARISENPE